MLALVNHIGQKGDQLLNWLVSLYVLVVNGAKSNEEVVQTFHEFLTVVGESCHNAIFDELGSKFVFESVDRF